MSPKRGKRARPFVLSALSAALLGACYDMPLIPENALAVAGSAGRASAGAGAGAPPASSGAPSAEGGSKPNGGGGASEGGAENGGASAGTAAQAGSGGAPRITWLALSGSTAPSSSAINAGFGIEGWFYAYGDGCSTLNWDASGRCASGKLCDPADLDNWGISIGFDFHNTGPGPTPPNAKLTWDPHEHGAQGVAWRVRGTAPKLQVWVLNMAASWQGQCTGMPCEISGPPDGVAPAPLNGELDFDSMVKDDWGGSGEEYTFDPAAVHALQFKIAAVKVGKAEFNFCIDALGIVRSSDR